MSEIGEPCGYCGTPDDGETWCCRLRYENGMDDPRRMGAWFQAEQEAATPSSGVTEGKAESGSVSVHVSKLLDVWRRQRSIVRPDEKIPRPLAVALDCLMNAVWLEKRTAQPPAPADEGKAESGEVDRLPPAVDADGNLVDHDCDNRRMVRDVAHWLGMVPDSRGLYDARTIERKLKRVIQTAAQPPAPADEAATVLAGLVDEIENLRQKYLRYSEYSQEYGHDSGHRAEGVRDALLLVRAAQQRLADRGQSRGSDEQ